MKKYPLVKCPTCQKELPYSPNNPYRPFCSERCKLIDLGAWAAEEHVIEGASLTSDTFPDDFELYEDDLKLH